MTDERGGTPGFIGASAGAEGVTVRSPGSDGLVGPAAEALGFVAAGGFGRMSEGERGRRSSMSESSEVAPSVGCSRMIGRAGEVAVAGAAFDTDVCGGGLTRIPARCFFFGWASASS